MASLIDSIPGHESGAFIAAFNRLTSYNAPRGYVRVGFMEREDTEPRKDFNLCPTGCGNFKAKVKGTDKNAAYCTACLNDRARNRYRVLKGLKEEVTCPTPGCGVRHSNTDDAGRLRVRCAPCNEKIRNASAT